MNTALVTSVLWENVVAARAKPTRGDQPASFFFGVRIMLGTILGRFSIICFRGLGLRIRVWVSVSVMVRVSVVLWSG